MMKPPRGTRVLVTCAAGVAGTTVVKLLREAWGSAICIIAADAAEDGYVRQIADEYIDDLPPVADEQYGARVASLALRTGAEVALPCYSGELERYAAARAKLAAARVAWPAMGNASVSVLTDKLRLYEALAEAGLRVPAAQLVEAAGVRAFPGEQVFVKPRGGAGSRGVLRIAEAEGLPVEPSADGRGRLEQVAVVGDELSLDGVVLRTGAVLGPIVRRRVVVKWGLAIVGESVLATEAHQRVFGVVARRLEIRGPLNVQVIVTADGELWTIDVNPRFPAGGMLLTAAMGLNMPAAVVADLLGLDSDAQFRPAQWKPMRHYRHFADVLEPRPDKSGQ
jgi:carbamoyl-phosphate synthase large subunit